MFRAVPDWGGFSLQKNPRRSSGVSGNLLAAVIFTCRAVGLEDPGKVAVFLENIKLLRFFIHGNHVSGGDGNDGIGDFFGGMRNAL